jgi:hypothetical protein
MPSYSRLSDLEAAWKGFQVGRYATTAERCWPRSPVISGSHSRDRLQSQPNHPWTLPTFTRRGFLLQGCVLFCRAA